MSEAEKTYNPLLCKFTFNFKGTVKDIKRLNKIKTPQDGDLYAVGPMPWEYYYWENGKWNDFPKMDGDSSWIPTTTILTELDMDKVIAAANDYLKSHEDLNQIAAKAGFIAGAKWVYEFSKDRELYGAY